MSRFKYSIAPEAAYPTGSQPGKPLEVNGRTVQPKGNGRVLVEVGESVRGGRYPESSERVQLRNYRAKEPSATIVFIDPFDPTVSHVYVTGEQPPGGGIIPAEGPTTLPF